VRRCRRSPFPARENLKEESYSSKPPIEKRRRRKRRKNHLLTKIKSPIHRGIKEKRRREKRKKKKKKEKNPCVQPRGIRKAENQTENG
jgi:hypothetical protein